MSVPASVVRASIPEMARDYRRAAASAGRDLPANAWISLLRGSHPLVGPDPPLVITSS